MGLGRYIRKKMNLIVNWALKEDTETRYYKEDCPAPAGQINMTIGSSKSSGHSDISISGMNFTVYAATGGKVIEFRSYDPRADRSINSLYVITDKENLGEELGQIITKESLCR